MTQKADYTFDDKAQKINMNMHIDHKINVCSIVIK